MKLGVDDRNKCRLVCIIFHLNRCRFAVAVAKCLGGSLFWDTVYNIVKSSKSKYKSTKHKSNSKSRVRGGDRGHGTEVLLQFCFVECLPGMLR